MKLEREVAETLGWIRELARAGQSQAECGSQVLAEKQTAEARIAALQQASAEDQQEITGLKDRWGFRPGHLRPVGW
jgi:cell division protein FtsB